MTQCLHFRAGLHNRKEHCLDDRENFGGLNVLPCIHYNVGSCEGHAVREEDRPQEWSPPPGKSHTAVIASSQQMFGDNPNQ